MRSSPSVFLLVQLIIAQHVLSSFDMAAAPPLACPPQIWGSNQYTCRWKESKTDSTVAEIFGKKAEYKFGSDMTLLQALSYAGGGDAELLSATLAEAVAALLNAEIYGKGFTLTTEEAIGALVSATQVPADIGRAILQKLKTANTDGMCSLEPCI